MKCPEFGYQSVIGNSLGGPDQTHLGPIGSFLYKKCLQISFLISVSQNQTHRVFIIRAERNQYSPALDFFRLQRISTSGAEKTGVTMHKTRITAPANAKVRDFFISYPFQIRCLTIGALFPISLRPFIPFLPR